MADEVTITLIYVFLKNTFTLILVCEKPRQKNWASAQTWTIAAGGDKAYYEGEVAEKIVKDLKELGSIITMEDLKNYR